MSFLGRCQELLSCSLNLVYLRLHLPPASDLKFTSGHSLLLKILSWFFMTRGTNVNPCARPSTFWPPLGPATVPLVVHAPAIKLLSSLPLPICPTPVSLHMLPLRSEHLPRAHPVRPQASFNAELKLSSSMSPSLIPRQV